MFTPLKLCHATATHNFKWVKIILSYIIIIYNIISYIYLLWDQTFTNFDV